MKNYLLILATVFLFLVGCKSHVGTDGQQVEPFDPTCSPKEKLENYIQRFEEATNDIVKLKMLIYASLAVEDIPDERDSIFKKLIDFLDVAPDCEAKIFAYSILISFFSENDVAKSFFYFQKALELLPKFPEYSEILKAKAYTNIAYTCSLYDDYENTQHYLFEIIPVLEAVSEEHYQKIKDETIVSIDNVLSMAYNVLISVYNFYGNQEKVDEYRKKLLILSEQTNTLYDKAAGYISYAYGIVWNEPDEALEYIEKAYKIGIDNQFMPIIYMAHDAFSCYEEATENIPGAILWLEKCMEFLKGKQRPYMEMPAYYNLACMYELSPGGEQKQLELCLKGLTIADSLQAKNFLAHFHIMLGQLYAKRGNYKEAFSHQKEYTSIREKMKNENSINQINFLTARFDAERREMKIQKMEERERMRKVQLITGLSVCVVILVLLWYMLHLRTRRNRILAQINATKDKFFSIISHDLKNPAVAQRDAIQQLVKNADLWSNEELTNYCSNLLKSADEEVELLYTLLSWAQIQTGGITYAPVTFDLSTHLRTDLSIIRKMAESKRITLIDHIPNHVPVTGDINMLITVIRNLLTNAVKFTPVGGEVTLTIEPTSDRIHTITVGDTGIGMTPEEISNIFCIDNMSSRKGTIGEQGTGLGLIVCKELLAKHESTLFVESEEGKGSRFWFEI